MDDITSGCTCSTCAEWRLASIDACSECWHFRGNHVPGCFCGCRSFVRELRLPPDNVIDFEQRRRNAEAVGKGPMGEPPGGHVDEKGITWAKWAQQPQYYAGYKASMDDDTKLRHSLVPGSFYDAVARAMTFGAKKYSDNNWAKGMDWDVPYSALLRHVFAWWGGKDRDPESGFSHLDHAAAMLAFLVEYEANPAYATGDTRYKGEV